jgi:anti-anti-sigma factor
MSRNEFSVAVRDGSLAGISILTVTGPLVLEHLVAFQQIWDRHPEPILILDVSSLSHIDSAAIGFLVNAYIAREKNGKKLALAGVKGLAERLLNVSRINMLIKMYPTVDDAESAFREARAAGA